MGTSLKIMDLELDLLTEETFCKKMAEYLSGDLFRVVHLVSLDYIDKYEEELMNLEGYGKKKIDKII